MSLLHFGEPAYWELRYQEELRKMPDGFVLFDWYLPYEHVHQVLETIIDTKISHKVLILGVGRSNIIDILYKKGFRDITAIDVSPMIISAMQNKYHSYAGVEFFVMDARELHSFRDETFTLVIDKGCADVMFCGIDLYESFTKMCQEVFRVLKAEGGVYAMVSHAVPSSRVPYLRCVPWAVDSCALPQSEEPTLYTLTRTTDPTLLAHRVTDGEAYIPSYNDKEQKKTILQTNTTPNQLLSLRGKVKVTAPVEVVLKMVLNAEDKELDYDYFSDNDDDDDV
eukprot:gene2060-4026_t